MQTIVLSSRINYCMTYWFQLFAEEFAFLFQENKSKKSLNKETEMLYLKAWKSRLRIDWKFLSSIIVWTSSIPSSHVQSSCSSTVSPMILWCCEVSKTLGGRGFGGGKGKRPTPFATVIGVSRSNVSPFSALTHRSHWEECGFEFTCTRKVFEDVYNDIFCELSPGDLFPQFTSFVFYDIAPKYACVPASPTTFLISNKDPEWQHQGPSQHN